MIFMSHIHDKIDFVVEVFVVCDNKVLLRLHDKYQRWLSVGGHIELEEDPNEAALREVKEEVGLEVKLYNGNQIYHEITNNRIELIPPIFLNIHEVNENHKHICLSYFALSETQNVKPQESEDMSTQWKWFGKDELEKTGGLGNDIRAYALKALEILKT